MFPVSMQVLSLGNRKPALCSCKQKCADNPSLPRSLVGACVVRFELITMPQLSISIMSRFVLFVYIDQFVSDLVIKLESNFLATGLVLVYKNDIYPCKPQFYYSKMGFHWL